MNECASAGTASRPLRVEEAYQHCMRLARDHYENFPTASRLIRRDLRPAVAAIYAFARAADDLADEGNAAPEKRLKQLDAWELLLERCAREELDHPVFLALGDAIRRHDLPVDCLRDLLTAFRMDVSVHAYATLDELMFYCRHSANPVGRLMLALHGVEHPRALAASDALCTALQLTNFWQDLSRDLPNGRCYLPEEWLRAAGLDSKTLLAATPESLDPVMPAVKQALQQAIEHTRGLFEESRALPAWLPLRLRLQVAATWHGGRSVLERTARQRDPLRQRPCLNTGAWLRLAPRILGAALWPRRPRESHRA